MSGMLQNNDDYRQRARSRQAEAHRWAEVDRLARLSRASRPPRMVRLNHAHHQHTARMWLRAWRMRLRVMLTPFSLRPHH